MTSDRRKTIAVAPLATEFNAYTGLFAQALRDTGARVVEYSWGFKAMSGYDAVVFHWPDQFINPSETLSALKQILKISLLKRTRGLKVVWVAHNVFPHDTGDRRSLLGTAFMKSLDGIIYLSAQSQRLVHDAHRLPRRVVEQVTVHGRYPAPRLTFTPPAELERVRLASIGLVRPYKNLGELVEATRDIDPSTLEVAIVGKRHDANYAAELEASAPDNAVLSWQLSDEIIDQTELDAAIDRAHGIVLPYRKILNSGSAILALSRARPVLVPAIGSMPELAELVGYDWVRLYAGELDGQVLSEFAAHIRSMPSETAPDLSPISWDRVTSDLRLFLSKLF